MKCVETACRRVWCNRVDGPEDQPFQSVYKICDPENANKQARSAGQR